MTIGIDASRAFAKEKTGIENYSFSLIRALREPLVREQVIVFVRKNAHIPFSLPEKWEVKEIAWSFLWTQGGLVGEMARRPVNVLFTPAHTLPWLHPKRSVIVVHGLEYEHVPNAYPFFSRWIHRIGTKLSCRWADRIIAVSEATKRDLINKYGIEEKKITVVHEGVPSSERRAKRSNQEKGEKDFFLFLGRLETRKNIMRLIEAFERFKEYTGASHQLVLAGSPGYGYTHIKYQIENSKYKKDIKALGYVGEEEKWELLEQAESLVFVSLAEGFGLPILEAQSVGTPVIASDIPIMREVAGEGAVFVDPRDIEDMAKKMREVRKERKRIMENGLKNVSRFSWQKSAREVAKVLMGGGG